MIIPRRGLPLRQARAARAFVPLPELPLRVLRQSARTSSSRRAYQSQASEPSASQSEPSILFSFSFLQSNKNRPKQGRLIVLPPFFNNTLLHYPHSATSIASVCNGTSRNVLLIQTSDSVMYSRHAVTAVFTGHSLSSVHHMRYCLLQSR